MSISLYLLLFFLQITVDAGFPYEDTYNGIYRALFSIFPPSLLALALSHLDSASDESGDLQGIKWSERYNYCYDFDDDEYCSENYCQDDCAFSIADAFLVRKVFSFIYVHILRKRTGRGRRAFPVKLYSRSPF